MEDVLFIAYQFPPRGGPGVQRSAALVRHLREFGYNPIVLTVTGEDLRKGGYLTDESLLKTLPSDLEIHRVQADEPVEFIRRLMKLRVYRWVWFFAFSKLWEWSLKWNKAALPVAKKLIREKKIRLVYSSSAPFSVMLLGRQLQKDTGVKWVADLRDPYTDAYAWQFPSKFHWLMQRRMESKLFPLADRLVVNSPEVKKLYLLRKLSTPEKMTVITNGF